MDNRKLTKSLLMAAVVATCLSACGKGGKPGDAQPVPKAEAPIPEPTPVTAPGAPDAAPDPGKAAPATPAASATQGNGTTEAK